MKQLDVKTLFISDVHLGSKGSKADELLELFKSIKFQQLVLVGDFIDGWILKRRHWWKQSHTDVIRKVLKYSKKKRVIYISGNHDDFLREIDTGEWGNIQIKHEWIYNNIFVVHGDLYDGVVKYKWLGKLGSVGYELSIGFDLIMRKFGIKKSLSTVLKTRVKDAIKYLNKFESQLVYQAKKRGCDTVICGHIHTPKDTDYGDIRYMNCGDWMQNSSFIVEHHDGRLEMYEHYER